MVPTEGVALPEWVLHQRHQNTTAPWHLYAKGHVAWALARNGAFSDFSQFLNKTP